MNIIDMLPWQLFKKLKDTHSTHMLVVTPEMMNMPGVLEAYSGPQEYVTSLFARAGYEVYRYRHNYDSLEGANPELGLVWMANDSVVVPGMEVWGLIGHNIREKHGQT